MNSADCLLQVVETRMQNNPDWVEGVWSLAKVWEQRADKPSVCREGGMHVCQDAHGVSTSRAVVANAPGSRASRTLQPRSH